MSNVVLFVRMLNISLAVTDIERNYYDYVVIKRYSTAVMWDNFFETSAARNYSKHEHIKKQSVHVPAMDYLC